MQMSTCVLKHIVTQCMNSEIPTPMYIHAKVCQNNCARSTYTGTCIVMGKNDASKHDPKRPGISCKCKHEFKTEM